MYIHACSREAASIPLLEARHRVSHENETRNRRNVSEAPKAKLRTYVHTVLRSTEGARS